MDQMSERKPPVEQNPLSPRTQAALTLVQGLLPVMTAITGGLWVAFTYLQDQRHQADALKAQADKDTQTRAIEARQPFTKVQLDTYIETAKVVGGLVSTNDWTAEEWKHNRQRFEELYWTELSMVEDTGVKEAMQAFRVQLQKAEANAGPPWKVPDDDFTELRERSYRLALALQASIESSWQINLGRGGS
jgi:hypothetical protein